MTLLPEVKTNKIFRYVSHPIAVLMYNITTPTDIGVLIRANNKVFWARNRSNPTIDRFDKIRVYENVWMHKYKSTYTLQIHIEDKLLISISIEKNYQDGKRYQQKVYNQKRRRRQI